MTLHNTSTAALIATLDARFATKTKGLTDQFTYICELERDVAEADVGNKNLKRTIKNLKASLVVKDTAAVCMKADYDALNAHAKNVEGKLNDALNRAGLGAPSGLTQVWLGANAVENAIQSKVDMINHQATIIGEQKHKLNERLEIIHGLMGKVDGYKKRNQKLLDDHRNYLNEKEEVAARLFCSNNAIKLCAKKIARLEGALEDAMKENAKLLNTRPSVTASASYPDAAEFVPRPLGPVFPRSY